MINEVLEKHSNPYISVVLPVLNCDKFLSEAIGSILSQTFRNFELIVINDGSTDLSKEIIDSYAAVDQRIKVVNRENKGLVASLNEAVDIARGEWIARMDADDISTPERFDKQLKWLNKTNTDVCGSWVQLFGTTDKRVLKHATTDEAIKFELMFGSCFAHPTVMIRTSLLKAFKYDSAWEKCEDYDLWERLAISGIKMTNVPEVLLKYRQHASQISTASWQKQFDLSQNIRLRYSKHLFHKLNINEHWAIEVVNMRGNSDVMPNMDIIDLVFESLLEQSVGEQKEVIFDHATRLYFRVAGDCSDIVRRWSKLNFLYGNNFAVVTKFKLFFLSTFKVKNNSKLFNFIKKAQFFISKSA